MTSLLVHGGVHVPACASLDAHIDAAVRETAGTHLTLDEFVDSLRADWQEEQLIAGAGDLAVISYWRAVETELMSVAAFGG